ncbi:MAG: hypothetical protein M1814_001281 [Vezdaea aestivalis]|nr:MAG: hypothetical protein M1814_001281 [Vezdaea aestivalis]
MATYYNEDNGQVYTETEWYPPPTTQLVAWKHRSEFGYEENFPSRKGPLSMKEICIRHLLQNLQDLESDTMTTFPPLLAKELWQTMTKRRIVTFNAWQCFATAYVDEGIGPPAWMRKVSINLRQFPPTSFIQHIGSVTFDFILTIRISCSSLISLRDLAVLRHLEVLHVDPGLTRPDERVHLENSGSDRAMRAFSLLTRDGGFARLQQIRLPKSMVEVSQTLCFLIRFPMLQCFVVEGTSNQGPWCREAIRVFEDGETSKPAFYCSKAPSAEQQCRDYIQKGYQTSADYERILYPSPQMQRLQITKGRRQKPLLLGLNFVRYTAFYGFDSTVHLVRQQIPSVPVTIKAVIKRKPLQQLEEYVAGTSAQPSRKKRVLAINRSKQRDVTDLLRELM